MARRGRRTRTLRKPASAFAAGVGSGGRTLAWEALDTNQRPVFLVTQFPNLAFTAGGFDIRYTVLVPVNLLRGAVTVVRIRGQVVCYFDQLIIAGTNGDNAAFIAMQIQLVPIANGVIQDTMVKSPLNAADLESNAIMWRRSYTPAFSNANGELIDGQRVFHQHQVTELDVKVQRRFDRANFALIMVVATDGAADSVHRCGLDVRALFKAPDGL